MFGHKSIPNNLPADFCFCEMGQHDFTPIHTYTHYGKEISIRWCHVCGTVRVDSLDGNTVVLGKATVPDILVKLRGV